MGDLADFDVHVVSNQHALLLAKPVFVSSGIASLSFGQIILLDDRGTCVNNLPRVVT